VADETELAASLGLGEISGVVVRLQLVELRDTGLFIRLSGDRSELTDRLDAEYRAAMDEYSQAARDARTRGTTPPKPPDQPGEALEDFIVSIEDDLGTTYRLIASATAGTGTEWQADRTYVPPVPAEASELQLRTESPGAPNGRHRLRIRTA
jgi:hypothetical protein